MSKKKQTPVPEGYELLKRDTRIKRGDLFLDVVGDPTGSWELTCSPGTKKWCSDLIYCRKIPTPKASKAPTKPKSTKVVWTPKKFPEMTIRTTKRQIRDHLELAIMELNDLGTKWAKAQNIITALKKKVSK